MNSIKINNLSYSLSKQANSDEQKTSQQVCNSKTKQKFKKPAFGASLPAKEGLGKKTINCALNLVDKFQRKLETGGFFFEFVFIDFVGLIVPRTIQAYNRNKEELGHPNYKAATEEFLREVLTGPSMFLIPMGFLLSSKKMFGSASQVKLDALKKFKEITAKAVSNNKDKNLVQNFYTEVVDRLYGSKITKIAKKVIVDDFLKLHSANPKEVKELKSKISETLISTNQKIGNSKKLGTSLAESSKISLDGLSIKVGDFVDECRNYSSDVINAVSVAGKGANKQLINKIHDFKEGARKLIVTTSVASMGAFLYCIPKIYQQNKQYPGLDGLADNSAKDDNKLVKNEPVLQSGKSASSDLISTPQKQNLALAFFAPISKEKELKK